MKQALASSRITGEWMWSDTIADAGPHGAETVMSRCAEMGITDIYLLVKGTGGKLGYLRTKHTGRLLRTERDILDEAVRAAHTCGIRLHAWVCNLQDAAYKAAHPEVGMWHYTNGQDNNHIRLCDPGYRAYMADIAAELAAYDIDGLHLDYIRCNHLVNGWSPADFDALKDMGADTERVRELVETTFGYNGRQADDTYIFNAYRAGDPDARLIAEYRRKTVRDYAAHIIAAARSVRENLIISAATMPEGAYDEAFAALHYGQDYRDAADLYDYICPMAYTGSYGTGEDWLRTVAQNAVRMGNRIAMGLQAFDGVTSDCLMREIAAMRSLNETEPWSDRMQGIVLFRSAQFDYAKITGSMADGLTVKTVSGTGQDYRWGQVDMPHGCRITDARAGCGYRDSTVVQIAPDGTSVRFFADDCMTTDAERYLYLRCDGDVSLAEQSPVVRAGGDHEFLVYTVYAGAMLST